MTESTSLQQHYSPQYVARLLAVSVRTLKRQIEDDPDVLRICNKRGEGLRTRVTLRIPQSTVDRLQKYWRARVRNVKPRRRLVE